MSESIYTILTNRTTETAVKNEGNYNMELPKTMPTADQFKSESELLAWAKNHDALHSCLQKGVQKHLIDLRAKFRLAKKDEAWSHYTAQINVDEAEWGVVLPPSTGKIDKARESGHLAAGQKMAQVMKENGLDEAMIKSSLIPVYGEQVTTEIMNDLT